MNTIQDEPNEPKVESAAEEPIGRWCLVANVVAEREWGPDHEIRPGTKNFSGGTKVYCDRTIDCIGEKMRVVGQHRGSRRWILLCMNIEFLTNFRAKCEYSPSVRQLLDTKYGFTVGGYDEAERLSIEEYAERVCERAEWLRG